MQKPLGKGGNEDEPTTQLTKFAHTKAPGIYHNTDWRTCNTCIIANFLILNKYLGENCDSKIDSTL